MIEDHEKHLADEHRHKADRKVAPHIKALVHYMHSLTEIWEYYRALGNSPPPEFGAEMKRAESEILEALREECNQGGTLHDYYQQEAKANEARYSK